MGHMCIDSPRQNICLYVCKLRFARNCTLHRPTDGSPPRAPGTACHSLRGHTDDSRCPSATTHVIGSRRIRDDASMNRQPTTTSRLRKVRHCHAGTRCPSHIYRYSETPAWRTLCHSVCDQTATQFCIDKSTAAAVKVFQRKMHAHGRRYSIVGSTRCSSAVGSNRQSARQVKRRCSASSSSISTTRFRHIAFTSLDFFELEASRVR